GKLVLLLAVAEAALHGVHLGVAGRHNVERRDLLAAFIQRPPLLGSRNRTERQPERFRETRRWLGEPVEVQPDQRLPFRQQELEEHALREMSATPFSPAIALLQGTALVQGPAPQVHTSMRTGCQSIAIGRYFVGSLLPAAFHLSNEAYGRIVAAFQFGMMTGELPMGWIMDRFGCRLGLFSAVLLWSSATGAQAFVGSGAQLGLTRFWMGSGECGNYSGGMKTVSQWFPVQDRTLAIGIFNSGSVIGSVVAPPLIVYLAQHYGFRTAFL